MFQQQQQQQKFEDANRNWPKFLLWVRYFVWCDMIEVSKSDIWFEI
jgi:hypothetical protein